MEVRDVIENTEDGRPSFLPSLEKQNLKIKHLENLLSSSWRDIPNYYGLAAFVLR
jgi:hypothetical protein